MGTALILTAPRALVYQDEIDRPLGAKEARVRTLWSGVSAGTELTYYRGTNPLLAKRWDAGTRLFLPADTQGHAYPINHLGYEEVGEIIELGPEISSLKLGDQIFGTWGHRTRFVAAEDYALLRLMPPGADPLFGIFSHLGAIALNGVHDAAPRVGETVAIFGLGALGQIVALLAKRSGARVIGVDLQPMRRELAIRLGADLVLDPARDGVAESIKTLTNGRGADTCIEVSGAAPALHEAIRSVVYAGRVVAMGFFQGEAKGLFLGDEFHHNRIDLVCSQISGVAPDRSNRWDKPRLWQTAVRLQAEGLVDFRPVITDTVPFREAPGLYRRLDAAAPEIVHSVLDFRSES